ncbi:MAG: endonuclease/exonuclease/phosphatase family protein [Nitrososphaera sp.]|nr:endonuclease/exonuclease/phosphatase family protein [Nitrososphaera sp.]
MSLTLIAGLFLAVRKFRAGSVYLACAAVNLLAVFPYNMGQAQPSVSADIKAIRTMTLNINSSNHRYDLVAELVMANRPDFLVLVEFDSAWLSNITALHRDYPYSIQRPHKDSFNVALFSKHRLYDSEIVYLGNSHIPTARGRVEIYGRTLWIMGLHLMPPLNEEFASIRNKQIEDIPRYVADMKSAVILLGDFNVSPWSYYFRKLLREAQLQDTSEGRGIFPTWPAGFFPLQIPIDHVLASRELEVVEKKIGTDVGSDHYPVLVDFVFSERW